MKLNNLPLVRATVVVALCLATFSAAGQSAQVMAVQPAAAPAENNNSYNLPPSDNRWRFGVSLNYSYVAGSDASFQGSKANSDAQAVNASATAAIPLNDQWFVPVRCFYHNLRLVW